jgi:hypothetical protein
LVFFGGPTHPLSDDLGEGRGAIECDDDRFLSAEYLRTRSVVGAKGRGLREGVLLFFIIVPLPSNITIIHVAGESGKDPLIMQLNGSPYRGFLEGRVEGDKYILLLHLSNMELKLPQKTKANKGGEADE